MKVKELMEILAKYDEEAEVELDGGYCSDGEDVGVLWVDGDLVWEVYHGV
jgi:hypothetical protein